MEPIDQALFLIETLNEDKLARTNLINFELQSSLLEKIFTFSNVATNKLWRDDIATLPHRKDKSAYEHFNNVESIELPDSESVDLLIGNDNALLVTLFEINVGIFRSNPHAILILLGWMACGGASSLEKKTVKACRVQACADLDVETSLSPEIVSRIDRIPKHE